MKNKIILKLFIFFLFLFTSIANSEENFKFDVTEIEILEKGNLFKGLKRGKIESDDGLIAPNGKKYYLRKHTINMKYNPYDKNTFARKNMIDIFKNSLILLKKNYYRIKI